MKISNDIRIIIVEDDNAQAELLNDKLMEYNQGYNIIKFTTGAELLDYCSNNSIKQRYNYIILDYYLQTSDELDGLNGIEVIKRIAKINPKVKIILYSAYENEDKDSLKELIAEPNVIDYVKKSNHSHASIQNIMRFDYAKSILSFKKKRFHFTLTLFMILLVLSSIHFLYNFF